MITIKVLRPLQQGAWLLAIALISFGCKKDKGGDDDGDEPAADDYYVSFKANGNPVKYTSSASAQLGQLSGDQLYSATMQGYQNLVAPTQELMGLILWDKQALSTRTYANANLVKKGNGDELIQVVVTYVDSNKDSYQSMRVTSTVPPLDKVVSDVQVTFTTLTASRVSGSFSGTLYKVTDPTLTAKMVITEGKFNLKRL
ncbi:MAG: hypothetical protein P0Y53_06065 [Candidatus Pseudobacter hemicellulosilyticus]|uniref:Uncharacterized protein n=1 Tax=Candidatus Pseudobacter hemicellulosilyticus TaxID=3121375 RepID=A0AAJ5WRW3_9BACT|nr:MAG: hypothetical protein P0Y53_06065 [Pseudobacter sp.]